MRILLTGAGGQLGRDLKELLASHDLRAYTHADLDIGDRNAVMAAILGLRPDWVINAAAFTDVDAAETNREAAFAANARGPANLADAAARAGAAIVHLSTDYVFDGRKGSPYTEEDQPHPLNVYGDSKYHGELRVLESGVQGCIVRTAWLYGRYGTNFVRAILSAAATGRPLRVVADQVGSPTASRDLATAIGQLIESPARGLFHVANGGECSRFELAKAIVGDRAEVIPVATSESQRPATRPANSALASLRWEPAGLTPLRHWSEALKDFLGGMAQLESPGVART